MVPDPPPLASPPPSLLKTVKKLLAWPPVSRPLRSLTERRHLAETGVMEGGRREREEGEKGGCFSQEAAAGGLQPRRSSQGRGSQG